MLRRTLERRRSQHTNTNKSIQLTLSKSSVTPPLPSTTAGRRSTFDRLPYGCLLFMYRLDLT